MVIPGRPLQLANARWGHWADRYGLVRDRKAVARILARSALARARYGPAAHGPQGRARLARIVEASA